MNGGMIKAAGPGAVAALAALMLSSGSVCAADLGGNCCADLEERVAELEATTVRKGNRKVSLTLYGWVNKGIMYWNDGEQSNTYFGVDNINFATRFGLRGDAKITPDYTAGFSILMDIISGATSSGVRRDREDRSVDNFDQFQNVTSSPANAWSEDVIIRMRDANVWVESKRLGRFTVGHLTNPGPQGIVDLGGTVCRLGGSHRSCRRFLPVPQQRDWCRDCCHDLQQHHQRGRFLASHGLGPVGFSDALRLGAERGVR